MLSEYQYLGLYKINKTTAQGIDLGWVGLYKTPHTKIVIFKKLLLLYLGILLLQH